MEIPEESSYKSKLDTGFFPLGVSTMHLGVAKPAVEPNTIHRSKSKEWSEELEYLEDRKYIPSFLKLWKLGFSKTKLVLHSTCELLF